MSAREQEVWAQIKALLAESGPDMRWRAVAFVVRGELDHARRLYQIARNMNNEQFKADLIRQAGLGLVDAADRLEARLAGVYPALAPLNDMLRDLWGDVQRVELAQRHLGRVTSPSTWGAAWPGAAKGIGISGYSTKERVAEVQAAIRRYVESAKPVPKSAPKKRTSGARR